jgi:hypothetical protein
MQVEVIVPDFVDEIARSDRQVRGLLISGFTDHLTSTGGTAHDAATRVALRRQFAQRRPEVSVGAVHDFTT